MILSAIASIALQSVGPQAVAPTSTVRIDRICNYVYSGSIDRHRSIPRYRLAIFQAAGVTEADGAEAIQRKVRAFWNQRGKAVTCNPSGFIEGGGNLIKLAFHRTSSEFMDDIISWGVDLNQIDPMDGRTALDYFSDEMARKRGSAIHSTLAMYYRKARSSGAKHRAEIDGVDCRVADTPSRIAADARCLNGIDAVGGVTLLDVAYDELERIVSLPPETRPGWQDIDKHRRDAARGYYQQLRAAGALHRHEIDGVDCRQSTRQEVCPSGS